MPAAGFHVRAIKAGEADACEAILRSLPKWFGIEESIVEYAKDIEVMETFVAETDGGVAGFLTLHAHNPSSSEIHVMGVREEHHGRGIGRALVSHAQDLSRSRGIEYLQVKTLGPSRPNADYERTRGFYDQLGFRPLEENKLWGETNPCLVLVKHLPCHPSTERTGDCRSVEEP